MRKFLVIVLVVAMMLSSTIGMVSATEINEVQDFQVEYLAAPAVAGLLLEAAGVDNRYGTGKDGGNYISLVAQHMGPGTDFDGVSIENELLYSRKVAEFLRTAGDGALGVLDPDASFATAVDNEDGTLTLTITVLDILGNGITGLNPLEDFKVVDSVVGGPFYFGTTSIPESNTWNKNNGVYSITLDRNLFSSRPAGYDDGWYRVWDIIVCDQLIEDDLKLYTTFSMVGNWSMNLYVGTTLYPRFVVIETHEDGEILGFFGIGYDADGTPTGDITGTVNGQTIHMDYVRPASFNYSATFDGTINANGNNMSGIWVPSSGASGTWTMTRQ